MSVSESRSVITELIDGMAPHDAHEVNDLADIRQWVASGAPLFRNDQPAEPAKHMAVYFVLLDEARRTLMLVDHVKAGCWLPPGGHVDENEDPRQTVVREAFEELGIAAAIHERFGGGRPFFASVTRTRGPSSHTDVTLWFVLRANEDDPVRIDLSEFHRVSWFDLTGDIDWTGSGFDPQMHRFVTKLNRGLADGRIVRGASAR